MPPEAEWQNVAPHGRWDVRHIDIGAFGTMTLIAYDDRAFVSCRGSASPDDGTANRDEARGLAEAAAREIAEALVAALGGAVEWEAPDA